MENRENPAWAIKERPILFSAPMVLALRENRKTQTRRIRGLDHVNVEPDIWMLSSVPQAPGEFLFCERGTLTAGVIRCPYGVVGDRLWTREAWKQRDDGLGNAWYRADGHIDISGWPWHPSIHMPRWASRDTLEVVSARPERLHVIDRSDCLAEGIIWNPSIVVQNGRVPDLYSHGTTDGFPTAKDAFHALWDSINGKKLPWSKNPWVWHIAFKRLMVSGKLPKGEKTS